LASAQAPGEAAATSAASPASAGASAPPADAKKGEALAKQSTCLNCHAVDAKKVGPSFKDVAKKYKGSGPDKMVADMKGKPVHQAAIKATKEEDLRSIARWIVSL
jgi:cytochrome c